MRLLAPDEQSFAYANGVIVAGLHEWNGYRHYSLFLNRELFACGDDLQSGVVDEVDGAAPHPDLKPTNTITIDGEFLRDQAAEAVETFFAPLRGVIVAASGKAPKRVIFRHRRRRRAA